MDPGTDLGEDVTALLAAWRRGDDEAEAALVRTVYPALHELVAHHLARERPDQSVQVTDVLHETYLKLRGSQASNWQDRTHFFAVASRVVRQVLVDRARRRRAEKRGGGVEALPLEESRVAQAGLDFDLVALDQALERLEKLHPQSNRIIELRFFGGLSIEETAEVLGLGRTSVVVAWRHAKAWLRGELDSDGT